MLIDKFGRPKINHNIENVFQIEPYKEETSSGVTYSEFYDDPFTVIWRHTTTGNTTTHEFGWGSWAERTQLKYVQINGMLDIGDGNASVK